MKKKKLIALLKIQEKLYNLDGLYIGKILKSEKINKIKLLNELYLKLKKCTKCDLYKSRINVVFGEGNENAKIMFVGEGPGFEEDKQGKPFVGRAGELLTKIINSMGLRREEVYITNVVKCHPVRIPDPNLRNNDRPPTDEEIEACIQYLEKQIEIIFPQIICCLGATAIKALLKTDVPISEIRGKIFEYYKNSEIKILPTYHPAALLRNPSLKPLVWKDMKLVMKMLGLPIK